MREEEKNRSITGIVETEKGNIVFSAENFKFTFMKTDFLDESIILKADESGYIYGRTFDEKVIAIYSCEDIEVNSIRILNTWNYIISKQYMPKQSMQSFKGIRFENGVIKTIYPCNGLYKVLEESKRDTLVYRTKQDCKEYRLMYEEKPVIWKFSSVVNQAMSLEEGNSLSNSKAILDIAFDEEQKFSVFYDYYGYVCDMASFLTFRGNVAFEKVCLFYDCKISEDVCVHEEFAECYVKKPDTVSPRKVVNIIPIRYVNDTVFENIFKNILKIDKKHKGLPLLIVPKDDLDVKTMDIGKIRNICSSLEMELSLEGVHLPVRDEMRKLIDSVQQEIKKHREGNCPLTDKTYDYIFSNISYWGQPLAEKAWEGWKQHENEMKPFLWKYEISITEENIQAFVKARNNMTHDGFTGISDEVCTTAFALVGLIYCCTLTRLGMQTEEIEGVMSRGLIG